jgi:transcriptional regulator with XRE-family HTH domain
VATTELSIAIAVLRAIRGWNQHDLAKAAGIHGSAVSDYERGKTVPELRTLQRLVSAMGFPLSALDQTRSFVEALSTQRTLTEAVVSTSVVRDLGTGEPVFSRSQLADNPAALRWELEQVSVEAGRVFSRMSRVMFALMDRAVRAEPPGGSSS